MDVLIYSVFFGMLLAGLYLVVGKSPLSGRSFSLEKQIIGILLLAFTAIFALIFYSTNERGKLEADMLVCDGILVENPEKKKVKNEYFVKVDGKWISLKRCRTVE